MIAVRWNGRLGNQLFQYALGRLLAEDFGYSLQCPPLPGFSATFDVIQGKIFQQLLHMPGHFFDRSKAEECRGRYGILLDGWFQQYEYYQPHKDRIRGWFNRDRKPGSVVPTARDIVMHVRRTQYTGADTTFNYIFEKGWLRRGNDRVRYNPDVYRGEDGNVLKANDDMLPAEFYTTILDREFFDRLFIVTDRPDDTYLRYFDRYNPRIISGDLMNDFNIVRSARRMIMSISTFSWWAAFLSEAAVIYMPVPDYSAWGPTSPVHLKVTDEDRFKPVPVKRDGGTFF